MLATVEGMEGRGEVCRLDLTDPDLSKAADVVEELADALSSVGVFVNNVGTGDPTGDFLSLFYDEWRRVLDMNLSGAFL